MSKKFNNENTELIINYTFEGAEWEAALEKTRKKLANEVTVPGFRKGKAPLFEALKHVNPMKIFDKTISDNIEKIYQDHIISQIDEKDILADNFRPKFDVTDLSLDKAVFEFVFPLFPTIKLGDYKHLKTKLETLELTNEEIESQKRNTLENYVVMLDSNEPIKLNDSVNFDFTGFVDGQKFEGGEAENFDLVIGSNQFIPGFEEQMIGLKKDETKDLNLKFPENYHAKNLAGKDVVFKVKINSIKSPNYPEVNDQFLKEIKINPLVNDLESFNEHIKNNALKEKISANSQKYINDAIDEVIEASEVKMSNLIIDETANSYYQGFINQIKKQGISEKDYIEFAKTSKDEILNLYKDEAKKNLTKSYVYGKIVDEEKLHATQEEYDERINSLAQLYGLEANQIKSFLKFEVFEQEKLAEKIFDKLAEINDKESLVKYQEAKKLTAEYENKIQSAIIAQVKEMSKEKEDSSQTKEKKEESKE
ncbi:Trigger factor [Metamycoplasma auris 15026]|uniref:Trigger factor n=1 Tax=Metamycoplasma auris 15026 TaxID=1188233 RepID=N9TRQ5_9BACT|nr:trigger factor [Metamycoplasma auris]ENY68740.1 Trigger factor [Metamycoplasma auris 15026]